MSEELRPPVGTVTIVFTDIVGSTTIRDRLVREHGELEGDKRYRAEVLDLHNQRIRPILERHHGFEVKTNGDSFMATFATPADAIACCADIQRSFQSDPVPTEKGPLSVRIGMHTGQPTCFRSGAGWDYDGHAVNIAARVEGLLKGGGQILCSANTSKVAGPFPDVRYQSHGDYTLRGISEPVEVVEVLWHDGQEPQRPAEPEDVVPYPWLTPWIGRKEVSEKLAVALHKSRLVTLRGPGGVGKTRLATETVVSRGKDLPANIDFVPLALCRNDEQSFLAAIREKLGISEADAPDLDRLTKKLAGGDRLLVLDNFETVIAAAPLVPLLAQTRGIRMLVTSQQALGVTGEEVVQLPPMAETETRRLFVELAKKRDFNPTEAELKGLVETTDGLPYLIEIIASNIGGRALQDVVASLRDRITTAKARVPTLNLPQRHQSVQACLEWAVEHLPAAQRDALPPLAVFAGSFDGAAAADICGVSSESLGDLVEASLLRFDRTTNRYSMLETTRAFARALHAPWDELESKHAEFFIERLQKADTVLRGPGAAKRAEAWRWIDAELENLRAAMKIAERANESLFLRGVEAWEIYLTARGYFTENLQSWQRACELIKRDSDLSLWAHARWGLGKAFTSLPTGNLDENLEKAISLYESALDVLDREQSPGTWAGLQNSIGIAYCSLRCGDRDSNLKKAIDSYEAALLVPATAQMRADIQNNLGNAYSQLSNDRDLNKAIEFYNSALEVRTKEHYPEDWALVQSNLGLVHLDLDGTTVENTRQAIRFSEAALSVLIPRESPVDWSRTMLNLGHAYARLAQFDSTANVKAIETWETVLQHVTEHNFPERWALLHGNLAAIYGRLGGKENLERAIACSEAAARGYAAVSNAKDAESERRWADRFREQLRRLDSPPAPRPRTRRKSSAKPR